jgi:hypothetical protein
MEFVKALQETFLSQDIAFSITHSDTTIRDKARIKAIASTKELIDAGVLKPVIYHLMSTTFIMLYSTNQLSLLDHKALMEEYMEQLYPDADYRADIMRQLMVQMSVLKAKGNANAGSAGILQAVQTAFNERNLNPNAPQ